MRAPSSTLALGWSAFRREHTAAALGLVALLGASVALALVPGRPSTASDGSHAGAVTVDRSALLEWSAEAAHDGAEVPEEAEDETDQEREELEAVACALHDWTPVVAATLVDFLETHDGPVHPDGAVLERPPRVV